LFPTSKSHGGCNISIMHAINLNAASLSKDGIPHSQINKPGA